MKEVFPLPKTELVQLYRWWSTPVWRKEQAAGAWRLCQVNYTSTLNNSKNINILVLDISSLDILKMDIPTLDILVINLSTVDISTHLVLINMDTSTLDKSILDIIHMLHSQILGP